MTTIPLKRRFAPLLLLLAAGVAGATELELGLEPSVAAALSKPQSDRFMIGGGLSVKGMLGLSRYLDASVTVGAIGLRAANGPEFSDSGSAWTFGGGLRLKCPHDVQSASASPWLDANALYVRTGSLDRFGYSVGAGLLFPLGDDRRFWAGPFVRYVQVVQPSRDGYDNRDLKALLMGFSFEVGTSPSPPPLALVREPIDVQPPPTPDYRPLDLTEKIQFASDEATIDPTSLEALDAVVAAMQTDRAALVTIEGHASSEGHEAHNQDLSERRAQAVLDYLVGHGIPAARLSSRGFSSSEPLETNRTNSGREANRRVEFVVHFTTMTGDHR